MDVGKHIATWTTALLLGAVVSGCAGSDVPTGSTANQNASFSSESVFGDGEGSADIGRREVIKNPTQKQLLVGGGELADRFVGSANAPITMIEFASLTCPYCRAFHETVYPQFKREYIDTGKVKLILREFPIGRSSGNAWLITRCASGQQYFELYEKFLKKQRLWVSQDVRTEKIFAVAAETGMSRSQFDACLKNEALIKGIKARKERARTLGIIGTPTFYIGETMVRSVPTMEQLRAIIDPMLARTKTG